MQSIDHLNLNKPERERGLKLKKVVELYWKKKKETKMRKESALVLFKPSVLNFFEEYYFKVTTSSYRTLGIVCLHTDTKQCHIFHFTHSGWCRSLGENASNLFCSNVPEEWSFLHFTTCKKPGISWQLILDIIVYDSSTLECELISSQWNVYFIKTLECR